jgi:hypothetical protein
MYACNGYWTSAYNPSQLLGFVLALFMEYLKETPPLGAVDQADVDAFYHNRLTEAGTIPELTFYFPTISQPTDNSTEFIIPGHVSSGDDDTQRNAFLGSSDLGQYSAFSGNGNLGQYSAFPGNGNLLGQYSTFPGNGDLLGQNSAFPGNDDLLDYNAFLGNDDARQHNGFSGNDDARVQPDALGNDVQVQRGASPANDDTRNLAIDHIINPISALYIDRQGSIFGIDSSAGENEQVRDSLNFVLTSLILCRLHPLPFISLGFSLTEESYHSM